VGGRTSRSEGTWQGKYRDGLTLKNVVSAHGYPFVTLACRPANVWNLLTAFIV